MKRYSSMITTIIVLAGSLLAGCAEERPQTAEASAAVDDGALTMLETPEPAKVDLDDLAIAVTATENRPISFTNKRAAYYYTQTHRNDHPEHAWFRGLNIAKRRIFSGYELSIDDRRLDRNAASVTVLPDRLERRWPGDIVETMRLYDDLDAVEIEISGSAEQIAIEVLGDQIDPGQTEADVAWFDTSEAPDTVIGVAGLNEAPVAEDGSTVRAPSAAGGFLVAVADTREAAVEVIARIRAERASLREERRARMRTLLADAAFLRTDDPGLTKALRWITLNMDQLVTRQQGDGIYAGVPWFNEYWGRDSFIALPGATLVTGQFGAARNILTSFAEFQDRDPESRFFGRVPNIVNPELIDYHTTDGTPRFVMQIAEYVRYSGDRTLVEELYPNVRASIEGALTNWVDADGYLLHADNETWMDARRAADLVPYSPRGTRANDIQALWHGQLEAGVYFARAMDDEDSEARWQAAANQVRASFERDFRVEDRDWLADRLDADNRADTRIRPNQLYALDLIDDPSFRHRTTRTAWESLVYPWGVASLDQRDPFFHPFHLAPQRWHKDRAYHNGAVWLWNNGIAMQRMIEARRPDVAWKLFANMNDFALDRGVVGGLAENSDAYPTGDERWPKLTGTYLQAWSNSEHLRVWYQHFLGIRPDMINGTLTIAPRLPAAVGDLTYQVRIGQGRLRADLERDADGERHRYRFSGVSPTVLFDLPGFPTARIDVGDGDLLTVSATGNRVSLAVADGDGAVRRQLELAPDADRQKREAEAEAVMKGVRFAEPLPLDDHPVMQRSHDGE